MQSCREGASAFARRNRWPAEKNTCEHLRCQNQAPNLRPPHRRPNHARIGRSVGRQLRGKGAGGLFEPNALALSHFPNSLSQRPVLPHTQRPRLNDLRAHPGRHARTAKVSIRGLLDGKIHGQMARRRARRHRRPPIPKRARAPRLLFSGIPGFSREARCAARHKLRRVPVVPVVRLAVMFSWPSACTSRALAAPSEPVHCANMGEKQLNLLGM
jgi:hypothetical protein